jgi:hypothetical protein
MSNLRELVSARRESVLQAYEAARADNRLRFLEGDVKATSEYIYRNQMEDAAFIVDLFYRMKRRVVSIQKKTKVGADGLMIEIAKLLTTHMDDVFVANPANVRIITGMSNAGWEKDMIDKAPTCFKGKIFHHGKLSKADLMNISNSLIIIDEIDTGDKECQVLHNTLKEAGVLDVTHMETHNNRFVFISATMIRELYDLYRWGELHELYKMTIPDEYIGHKDFVERGIIQEFYSLATAEAADRWIQEDILDYYGTSDFRVHIVRVTTKTVSTVQNACIRKGVAFRNHTSTDRLSQDEINELFQEPITNHIVLGVKGFFRRANLIPNVWKLRIGATHELYTTIVDNNVQIQGLPGRMTGYWRSDIDRGGHKTGPHRTSLQAIEEYEKTYEDPFGLVSVSSYQTNGFKMKKGKVASAPSMLSIKNIANLVAVDLPAAASTGNEEVININLYRIYDSDVVVSEVCAILDYEYRSTKSNADGFRETSLNNKKKVVSLQEAVKKVHTAYGTRNGEITYRSYYPCYVDTADSATLRFVVIIRPGTDPTKLAECDARFAALAL